MNINAISVVKTTNYRPAFGAVSISGGRKLTSEQEAKILMEKLRAEMQSLTIQTDIEPIRAAAAKAVYALKQECEELISKVSVSVSEKGVFESKKSYKSRCDAAHKEKEQQKAKIQADYDEMIKNVQKKRDAEMSAVELMNLAKEKRAKEIVAEMEKLVAEQDMSTEIKRRRNSKSYEDNRSESMRNRGFDRLAGYEEEKNILYKYFIKEVRKERNGEQADIPDSILFFGPRGMGKTMFYRALAEESECNTIEFFTKPEDNYKRIFAELNKKAENANKYFEQTGIHSIIFIDELTNICDNESTVISELSEFLRTCSEKYHCTVFAATNYPENIALPLEESEGLFPIRVLLDPPDHEDKKEILKFYLKNRLPENTDYEKITQLIEEKERNNNQLFSISKIKEIGLDAGNLTKELTTDELVEKINSTPTNITHESIEHYKRNYTNLAQNIVEE